MESGKSWTYPTPRKDETVKADHFGREIADPYRWMEDPDAEETAAFVTAQNDITMPYLRNFESHEKIKDRLAELWKNPRFGLPGKKGNGKYYFNMNPGLRNQNIIYVADEMTPDCYDFENGKAKVFLNPNTWSEDGTKSLTYGLVFSEQGKYVAYRVSEGGSDWTEIHIRDVEEDKVVDEPLKRVKFSSLSWTHDQKGFFYNIYPETSGEAKGTETSQNLNQQLKYHRLGTSQSEDLLVYHIPENPTYSVGGQVSEDGEYLVIGIYNGCLPENKVYFYKLNDKAYTDTEVISPVKLVDEFKAKTYYITNKGSRFFFLSNDEAPNKKVISMNVDLGPGAAYDEVIPENKTKVLQDVDQVNQDYLVLTYMEDVKNTLYIHELESGKLLDKVPAPIGSIPFVKTRAEDDFFFFIVTSFLSPGEIFRYQFNKEVKEGDVGELDPFKKISPPHFNPDDFTVNQVFYSSKDGTKVPMFLVHRKNIELNGENPTILYGYGGFDISILPYYSASRLVWLDNFNGILAVANIRGGGEYGSTWHEQGMRGSKQNVFDDFIAAGEYLVNEKYTKSEKLIIQGGSNGGLLVAACANQRPDLFGAILCQVGVLDMLRFHKSTIGHAWISDYGDPDQEESFKYLVAYSPLQNIPTDLDKEYPATLILTGDHDDRVSPWHSLKFVATLQEFVGKKATQTKPLLARIDCKSGHGAGKPTTKIIGEHADIYSFAAQSSGASFN
eukprot:CAMPEP_0115007026 /NCGR_PEP_ID=MMETSP0216-20121206/20888_1 /TAXON_ID=223996 /ORGANISM="Protocruzia adherens, Strain Boccale" /LENGTH=725 /DNA_ID=CAMNT_0002373797 /DNA_START=92 /DNA_END=2269 /DNA_ORIENTATION=-